MDAKTLRNLQILALNAIENPDYDAFYRRTCRWYSREFSTPLVKVFDLDPVHIMQTYYEEKFGEAYQPDDKNSMEVYDRIKTVVCFPEQAAKVEEEDADWEEQMLKDIEQQNTEIAKKAQDITDKPSAQESPNIKDMLDHGEEVSVSGEDIVPDYED